MKEENCFNVNKLRKYCQQKHYFIELNEDILLIYGGYNIDRLKLKNINCENIDQRRGGHIKYQIKWISEQINFLDINNNKRINPPKRYNGFMQTNFIYDASAKPLKFVFPDSWLI